MPADPPVVLVTGATGALGRAVVRRFAADGARLALVGRHEDRLRRVAAAAGLADDAWMPVLGELTDRDAAQAVVDAVEARFGPGFLHVAQRRHFLLALRRGVLARVGRSHVLHTQNNGENAPPAATSRNTLACGPAAHRAEVGGGLTGAVNSGD